MIRALITGAGYGLENVGDNAILAAMLEQLDSIGDLDVTVITRESKYIAEWLGVKTLELAGLGNRLRTYRAVASTDVLVLGGGAFIGEYTRGLKGLVAGTPGYPYTLIATARALRKPIMVYGIGVERIEDPLKRAATRLLYDRVQLITVRDADSRRRLSSYYRVSKPPLFATADPANTLSVPPAAEIDAFLAAQSIAKGDRPLVGISFAYGIDKRDELLAFIAETADHLATTIQARVVFLPANIREENDRFGMGRVMEKMRRPECAQILRLPYTHRDFIGLMSRMDLVIASRMHPLIFASLSNTPIVGISRGPKIDAFLEFFGLRPGIDTRTLDIEQFKAILDETWSNRQALREKLEERRAEMRAKAFETVRLFEEHILSALRDREVRSR
jgi:polysaccharide pyruvyl transferase WcaK-like protein